MTAPRRRPSRLLLIIAAPFDYAALILFVSAAFALKCRDWINGGWRNPPPPGFT